MSLTKTNQGLKRLLDIVIVFLALLLLSPLYLLISLLVLIFFGRPIFFVSERVGKNKILYRMLKFRSMTNAFDEKGDLLPDEKRLVPFGRFLRRTSMDELPQLISVLKGEMSIVGPRPILPNQIELVPSKYQNRFRVRPGMTSWTSVNFLGIWRSWEEKMRLDSEYVDNYSLWFDIKIFFLTFWALICRFLRYKSGSSPGVEEMEQRQKMMENR